LLDGGEVVLPQSMPEPFRSIARDCLHTEPEQRCTIDSIRGRLGPAPAPAPVSSSKVEKPKSSNSNWVIAALVALVLLIVLVKLLSRLGTPSAVTEKPAPAATAETAPAKAESEAPKPANVKGTVSQQVMPNVPHAAARTIQGRVKVSVRVNVDATGTVTA